MTHSSSKAVLQSSYESAVNLIKTRARTFYVAFSLLPPELFHGVAAVYAFCRTADDIVDRAQSEEAAQALKQLSDLEELLQAIFSTTDDSLQPLAKSAQTPAWLPAFAHAIKRFDLPPEPFFAQLEGQRMDVLFSQIESTDQLIAYARKVAGSVGNMLLPFFALDRQTATLRELREAFENLGVAMQITNILRDVGEDLRLRNRIYLPLDLLGKYGVTPEALVDLVSDKGGANLVVPANFIQLWEHLAEMADGYYRGIEAWLCYIHPDCRMPLLAAAQSYRAIADAVRSNAYNCFTVRCYTSQEERVAIRQEADRTIHLLDC